MREEDRLKLIKRYQVLASRARVVAQSSGPKARPPELKEINAEQERIHAELGLTHGEILAIARALAEGKEAFIYDS